MTVLSIEALDVSYGPIQALRRIDLAVGEGEIVGVVGANGAGKTTLLRTISGLVKPRSGRVRFGDREIQGWPSRRIVAAGIAHVPEGRRVWPEMTVKENLLLGGSASAADESIETRLDQVVSQFPELTSRLEQQAGTLSGGEQQMLAIGRGLMSRPKLLMLDEPSLGLAPIIVQRVKQILESLNRSGLTILLSEQNARLAFGATHRAYVIAEGQVISSGTPQELLRHADLISAYLGESVESGANTNQGGEPRP
jgi:branched-chain amino acid transport system ATP-binding protein